MKTKYLSITLTLLLFTQNSIAQTNPRFQRFTSSGGAAYLPFSKESNNSIDNAFGKNWWGYVMSMGYSPSNGQ